jgi:hypothetical protein
LVWIVSRRFLEESSRKKERKDSFFGIRNLELEKTKMPTAQHMQYQQLLKLWDFTIHEDAGETVKNEEFKNEMRRLKWSFY